MEPPGPGSVLRNADAAASVSKNEGDLGHRDARVEPQSLSPVCCVSEQGSRTSVRPMNRDAGCLGIDFVQNDNGSGKLHNFCFAI
ncbi:hypothetical protein NDU88_001587 [Pleurodeles waltl]|uniref:Uncharacterized protein n=1 Tax=Pleurodeles waltl TaxID=8319 RepID=A0AAV7WKZ8_PLEWA|nr:hypothetical protein NDU88_001587 [Pleurodeles waltl]